MVKSVKNEDYKIYLRFFHPSIDPDSITETLNADLKSPVSKRHVSFEPDIAWKSGDDAKTPIGRALNFRRKESYWCYSTDTENKKLSLVINELIECLLPHRDFLHRIVSEKGRIEFYLGLPGSVNIGDTLTLDTLAKLVDLKIALSVEVFPQAIGRRGRAVSPALAAGPAARPGERPSTPARAGARGRTLKKKKRKS